MRVAKLPWAASAAGALLAAACASPRGISTTASLTEPAKLEARRSLAGAPVAPQSVAPDWWKRYGDPQLDAVVAEAVAGNPSIGIVRARVEQAQAAAAAARLALTPAVDASLQSSRQRLSENGLVPPPFGGRWIWQNQAMLDFRYEFDFWGRNRKAYEAALGSLRAAQGDAEAARLLLETTVASTLVLPTHRIVQGLGEPAAASLPARAASLFDIEPVASVEALVAAFSATDDAAAGGRFGLVTRGGRAILRARRTAFEPWLPRGGAALRGLDVTLLGVALERLCGIDADALAAGDRIAYTKSAAEAVARVGAGTDGADAAFLLEPTPVASIMAVAADGDVMPQKSTYFYPKPLTGLVINPHEW